MPRKGWIHILPHHDGWAVQREGAHRPVRVFDLKPQAERLARRLARKAKVELFIHDHHGHIINRDSFGNDPFPPAG
jgi:hypothetical protein